MAMAIALRRLSPTLDKPVKRLYNGGSLYYMVRMNLFIFFYTITADCFSLLCSVCCSHPCLMKLYTTRKNLESL